MSAKPSYYSSGKRSEVSAEPDRPVALALSDVSSLADRPLSVAKTVKSEPRLNVTKKAQGPRDGTTLSEREALGWLGCK